MRQIRKVFLLGSVVLLLLLLGTPAWAIVFSLDPASPSLTTYGYSSADIFASSPGGGFSRIMSATELGLSPADDIDAISLPFTWELSVYFSVDRGSIGTLGSDIRSQAVLAEQASDIFEGNQDTGHSSLDSDESIFGLVPNDNLDALDMQDWNPANTPLYFSLAPGSPALSTLGASPADILMYENGVISTAFLAAEMGLTSWDDVDAFLYIPEVVKGSDYSPGDDGLVFSLAPGSPSLLANPWGWYFSAADVFIDDNSYGSPAFFPVGGPNSLFFPPSFDLVQIFGGDGSLIHDDNLDALGAKPVAPIPEPATMVLFGTGLVGLAGFRKKFKF